MRVGNSRLDLLCEEPSHPGRPLVVIELKNTGDANATIDKAFDQLQTYTSQIPRLFWTNELLLISDGSDTGIPRPRNDKVASSAIELATCTVATSVGCSSAVLG